MVDELRFTVGMEGGAFYAGNVISLMRDAGAKLLQDAKLGVEGSGVKADTRILECAGSRLADVVNEQVKSWDADLIVIGSHGRRGASRFFLGSDAEQILRAARVPVLLVRAPESRAAVAEPRPKHS
jgi:nucleotide-binding universal stress UspA family protein